MSARQSGTNSGLYSKGQSGNPKGRPRSKKKLENSAFDAIFDRKLPTERDGGRHEVTAEEALQHKLLQQAMSGSKPAQYNILRMVEKREKMRRQLGVTPPSIRVMQEYSDRENARPALLLLDIISHHFATKCLHEPKGVPLLEPWAVKLALARRPCLAAHTLESIKAGTWNADTVIWPVGVKASDD